jgi:hypothetical protein
MATKRDSVAAAVIRDAQLEFALENTLSVAITAAAIFCQQYEAAAAEPAAVRSFLEREYPFCLIAVTDACTNDAAATYGNSDELVAIVVAAQEVSEYASLWLQNHRLGRVVVDLPFVHTCPGFDTWPLDYVAARARHLRAELRSIKRRSAPARLLKVTR